MQKKAIRLITVSDFHAHTSPLFFELELLKLQDHIKLQTFYFMHQFFIGKLPKIFDSFFIKTSDKHNVNTRFATRTTSFYVPKIRWTMDLYCRMNSPFIQKKLSMHFIKFYYVLLPIAIFWCFCYLLLISFYFIIVNMLKNYLFGNPFPQLSV